MESQLLVIQMINECEQTNLLFIYFTVSAIWLISQVDFSLLSRGKLSPTLCRCRCRCCCCWPATESCPGANAPIRYVTIRYETIRNVYDTDKRNIFAWGRSDSNVVWVCTCMCVCVYVPGRHFGQMECGKLQLQWENQGRGKGVAVEVATLTINRRNARTIRLHA